MNNLFRFYNQNRRKIWIGILIIIGLWILLRLVNYFCGTSNNYLVNNSNSSQSTNSSDTGKSYTSNTSGTTGRNVSESSLNKANEVINKFYDYCNNKDLNSAYGMLTDECKELIYQNIELFANNFYKNIFNGKILNCTFENWYDNTYYVCLKEDALAYGGTSSSSAKYDYVTVVNDKINVSSYVGRTYLNKEKTKSDITIKVIYRDTFMDYEIYNIDVLNNSNNEICLLPEDNSKDICIVDSNGNEYGVYNHELLDTDKYIMSNYKKNVNLKFYSSYVSKKTISKMVFEDLNFNVKNVYYDIFSIDL